MTEKKDFKTAALEHIAKGREKKDDSTLKDCPQCKQKTHKEAVYYNPDRIELGMVWKCLQCGEIIGWVS